jgi:hypothetical protein
MGDFAATLRATLEGMPDSFSEADRDLHHVVADAARAVEQLSDGQVRLALHVEEEAPDGVRYSLQLTYREKAYKVSCLSVPRRGYPIAVLDSVSLNVLSSLKSKEQIREYLEEMAGNPDSALVQYLAFARRKNGK